jgi:hypothetical protein
LSSFHSSDSAFDGYFRQRYAGEEVRERLRAQKNLQALMGPFRPARCVGALAVSSNGVECVFDFGRPPYIPAKVVKAFLPAVVDVAQVMEAPFLVTREVATATDDTVMQTAATVSKAGLDLS